MIAKADKSNPIVVMNKTDYANKMHDFFKDNNISTLPKDLTTEYNKTINKCLNEFKT